jgi:hypothetical protein
VQEGAPQPALQQLQAAFGAGPIPVGELIAAGLGGARSALHRTGVGFTVGIALVLWLWRRIHLPGQSCNVCDLLGVVCVGLQQPVLALPDSAAE